MLEGRREIVRWVSDRLTMIAASWLAAGLALFCLRYLIPEERWSERAAKISFWSLNIGLAWMCFATLFPLGILQLYESVNNGYFDEIDVKKALSAEKSMRAI